MCILKPELLLIKNIVSYKKFVQDYIREDTPENDNDDASDSYGNDNDGNNYNVMFMIMIIMILR